MRLHHVISTAQFLDKELLEDIFAKADFARETREVPQVLAGKSLVNLFFEPSTRTMLSFHRAIRLLGGDAVNIFNAGQYSSAIKGETIEDTVETIHQLEYSGIILRHTEKGMAERAARTSTIPIINAGDGAGEHPTQALLDIYAMRSEIGPLRGKTVALVGDLKYGRTIHSLIPLLSLYDAHMLLISPEELRLPKEYQPHHAIESGDLNRAKSADVVYVTRVQKERFSDERAYEQVKDAFQIDTAFANELDLNAIILHPLPRVNEISREVDANHRAKYFPQIKHGLYLRIGLLQHLFTPEV